MQLFSNVLVRLNRPMKAIVYYKYGLTDVLEYKDIDKPVAGDDDVLVRVHAASINPYDYHFIHGTPHLIRLMSGLRKPKSPRTGADVAGVIEEVGSNVTEFKSGDEVFGMTKGSFAEYVCDSGSGLVRKPDTLTFEQAAAVPMAGITALQGLHRGQIQAGQKVLINGASGGIGTFAVQIAKSFGAEVTGVCSSSKMEVVRVIGADRVIDYTREDFTKSGECYDLVLDCFATHSLADYRRILNPKGIYVGAGGPVGSVLGLLIDVLKPLVMAPFISQKFITLMAKRSKEDMGVLAKLLETGKVIPVVDRRYALSEVPEAIRYLEEGHARGKVVIVPELNH